MIKAWVKTGIRNLFVSKERKYDKINHSLSDRYVIKER